MNERGKTGLYHQRPRAGAKETRREARQAQAIPLLLQGRSQEEVASSIGVNPRTLRRWLAEDPEFRAQLNSAVAAMRDDLTNRVVSRLAPQALDVLERGVTANHSPENFRDQLQAVKEISRVVFQTSSGETKAVAQVAIITPTPEELAEVERRLPELERQVLPLVSNPEGSR